MGLKTWIELEKLCHHVSSANKRNEQMNNYCCLFKGIQQENRHIRALQQENKELRAALEEHQNAIELIMSKYRQHMGHLLHQTKLDSSFIVNREKAAVSACSFRHHPQMLKSTKFPVYS